MKKYGIILAALALVFSTGFTACSLVNEVVKSAVYGISGRVVNVKAKSTTLYYKSSVSSDTLDGAIVYFVNVATAKSYVGIVSNGVYNISNVDNGTYIVTGVRSGWAFLPSSTFTVSATTTTAPNLLAFPVAEAGLISVVMTWTNPQVDMDLHMTWGAETAKGVNNPNHLYTAQLGGASTVSGTGWTASLDRDVYGSYLSNTPLAETITFRSTGGTIAGDANAYSSPVYAPLNDFRFFVNAWGTGSTANSAGATVASTTGDTTSGLAQAGATIHIFKGSTHYGSFYAPLNTAEQTLKILRVQFDGTSSNRFAVYTDTGSVDANVYRDLSALPTVGVPVSSFQ